MLCFTRTLFYVAVLLLSGSISNADIVSGYGTYVNARTWANCPSFCSGSSQGGSVGGEFFASANITEDAYGATGIASASFASGSSYLPNLSLYSEASGFVRSYTTAFASQGFTYVGEDKTIVLSVELHGIIEETGGFPDRALYSDVAIIRGSSIPWQPDFGTLIYEEVNPDDILDMTTVSIDGVGDQTLNGSISFEVESGDNFFVVASLNGRAQSATVDSLSTLSMGFSNPAGLTAVAVPEPSAGLFLGLLLSAVGAINRVRRDYTLI